jgi:hypothetical protein
MGQLIWNTSGNAAQYARQGLFKTLGIEDFTWSADPQGHTVGESSLRLKPRDMSKLGLLYARRGQWEDVDRRLTALGYRPSVA